jgi:hypothetical protein
MSELMLTKLRAAQQDLVCVMHSLGRIVEGNPTGGTKNRLEQFLEVPARIGSRNFE